MAEQALWIGSEYNWNVFKSNYARIPSVTVRKHKIETEKEIIYYINSSVKYVDEYAYGCYYDRIIQGDDTALRLLTDSGNIFKLADTLLP